MSLAEAICQFMQPSIGSGSTSKLLVQRGITWVFCATVAGNL